MKNKDGQTPLDIEKSYSDPNQQIIELLESHKTVKPGRKTGDSHRLK
jgi:hypothetical protein